MKILISYKEEILEAEMSYYGHILIWPFLETFSLSTDAHNVKKHRAIKTF